MLVIFILLLTSANFVHSTNYDFNFEDEEIFQSCEDSVYPDIFGPEGLLNISEFKTTMKEEGILVEGNLSVVWDIQLLDRVEIFFEVFYFDRGTWSPTIFNLKSKDFCSVMYNENQYWYTFFTKHITNAADVKDNCLNVSGTKFILEPYILRLKLAINGQVRNGRYKIVLKLTAFDQFNVKRPTAICMEFRGNVNKI